MKARSVLLVAALLGALIVASGGCTRHAAGGRRPTPSPVRTILVVKSPLSTRTAAPIATNSPIFAMPPPPSTSTPEPEPVGTPYHFRTAHLYVAGSMQQNHLWMYELPFRNNSDAPAEDVILPSAPHGLAVDHDGSLFVAVSGIPSILKFHTPIAHGDQPMSVGGQTPSADAIAINAEDRIFETDPANKQIVVYAHFISPNTAPTFAMTDPFIGAPLDAVFNVYGELFGTNSALFPPVGVLLKYQLPLSVTRQPVSVVDRIDPGSHLTFGRFPQRLYLAAGNGSGIDVYDYPYEQLAFSMPHVPGAYSLGRLAVDTDDNLYVIGTDGQQQYVYVYYRPHGQASQPTFIISLPATRADGIVVGP